MSSQTPKTPANLPLYAQHSRAFETNRFVYAVLSRRSGGLSVGVNLNPDKVCNFDCIYCQVDRTTPGGEKHVDLEQLSAELDTMLGLIRSGEVYKHPRFEQTPPDLRRLNDIAFSGDGEPTTCPEFEEVVRRAAQLKREHGLGEVNLVLITNATLLHRPRVARALKTLDDNQGEIWAKLEAGTEEYYRRVERTSVPFEQVLSNLTAAAQVRPIVIQALFMCIDGVGPSEIEQDAFCERLSEITQAGGQIKLVQVYTVARRPAEASVTPLGDAEVDALVARVGRRTQLPAVAFYGIND